MRFSSISEWLTKYARWLALLSGTVVVSVWTLLRHITNGVNFDVVGQIGVVAQWSQGLHSHVQLGATNYLLKFPLYYAVNQLHFLTPMHRLLLLALICNVLTFGLIFIINEKILDLYRVKRRRWLYLVMLWLATIAGKVFWVDYANSRNLETVGGLYLVYLLLKFWRTGKKQPLAGAVVVGSLTFFADPLQLYILIGGLGLSLVGYLVTTRTAIKWQRVAAIVTAASTAVIFAKIITVNTQNLLHISYLKAPLMRPALTFEFLKQALNGSIISTLKIFDANNFKQPYGLNVVRELINALILAALIAVIVRLVVRRRLRPVGYLGLAGVVISYGLYIASGQVLLPETARYLIMVPLLLVLVFSAMSDRLPTAQAKLWQGLWLSCLLVSTVLLCGALAISWPQRHSKDAPIYVAVSYMKQNQYRYALASREVGVTTSYFSQGAAQVLPMGCSSDHQLQLTDLFYDSAGFAGLQSYDGMVPILVSGEGIRFGAITCSQADIIAQFGKPLSRQAVPGIGTALLYDAGQLKQKAVTGMAPPVKQTAAATDTLTTLAPLQACDNGMTDVIVAHPDDDILFMNPALEQQLLKGCLRTVYVTAADAGIGPAYWQGRERGIEAAYALMTGATDSWLDVPVIINNKPVLERVLADRPSLALVFLRLPDGNLTGDGFATTRHQSLARLSKHVIKKITAVDNSASYSFGSLIQTLAALIVVDQPTNIYTQLLSGKYSQGDHSDHKSTGRLATLARSAANSDAQMSLYFGYPDNALVSNLNAVDTVRKKQIFDTYAAADSVICAANHKCSIDRTYGNYFSRSYKIDVRQPDTPKIPQNNLPEMLPTKDINSLLFRDPSF